MTTSRGFLVRLALIVFVWYLATSYVPQIVGTCMDAVCGFSVGEVAVSLAMPLLFFAVPVLLEMILSKQGLSAALRNLGVTRFSTGGMRMVLIFLLPMLTFYPLYSLLTNTPLGLQPHWEWRVLSAIVINGLVEETMVRGFVFRHLREGRTFWRAAALSTVIFAGYHLPLIISAGVAVGITSVIIAIPLGFFTAYVYERGNNTIWAPALFHAVFNGLAFIVLLPAEVQLMASALYLLLGIIISSAMVVYVYRRGTSKPETLEESRVPSTQPEISPSPL